MPTTRSSERSVRKPTRTSAPTPSERSCNASRFARRSSSPIGQRLPLAHTATRVRAPAAPAPRSARAGSDSSRKPTRAVGHSREAPLAPRPEERQGLEGDRRAGHDRHAARFRSARATGGASARRRDPRCNRTRPPGPSRCRRRSPAARSWNTTFGVVERGDGHVAEIERRADLVDAERDRHERRAARGRGGRSTGAPGCRR